VVPIARLVAKIKYIALQGHRGRTIVWRHRKFSHRETPTHHLGCIVLQASLAYRWDEKFRESILGIATWFVVLAELILMIRQWIRGSLERDITKVHRII
jgi:hypothetical protein